MARIERKVRENYPSPDRRSLQYVGLGISNITHTAQIEAASAKAREMLPELRKAFNAGLKPGEFIELKAPVAKSGGGREYLWVEVVKWEGDKITGLLKTEPYCIPAMHAGQVVQILQQDVFDFICKQPDGSVSGQQHR